MKKIIKPATKEECVYYSDFSGKLFSFPYPEVLLSIDFCYGSEFDNSKLEFHLTDEDATVILNLLKNKLTQDKKTQIKNNIKRLKQDYQSSCESRDWSNCECLCNNIDLLKKLL